MHRRSHRVIQYCLRFANMLTLFGPSYVLLYIQTPWWGYWWWFCHVLIRGILMMTECPIWAWCCSLLLLLLQPALLPLLLQPALLHMASSGLVELAYPCGSLRAVIQAVLDIWLTSRSTCLVMALHPLLHQERHPLKAVLWLIRIR